MKTNSERYKEWKQRQLDNDRKQRQVFATDSEWTYLRAQLAKIRQLEHPSTRQKSVREVRERQGCWNPSAKRCDCPACGGFND